MHVDVHSRLPAARAEKSQTCLLGGGDAVVDFLSIVNFFRILKMMNTDTPKQVNRYEKKIK
tara:strand:- start:6964 stop:7146 length:183 start_codon:yes stop_codon:yes gene_type:complete